MGTPIKLMTCTIKSSLLRPQKYKHIRDVLTHAHRPTTSFLWEVVQVQSLTLTLGFAGQKVCFPRFTPLLFIHETERKREGESRRGRETERNPPVRGLWCGKQNLLFNLPSNGIHMTHPELVHTVQRSFFLLSFSLCLLVCVCMHMHAHMALVVSTCVCDRGENEITCYRLNLLGVGWDGQRKY